MTIDAEDIDVLGQRMAAMEATLPPKFKTKKGSELMATNYPPCPWFIDDFLTPGLVLLSAPPKSYKSWLALDLALCMAGGRNFDGKPVKQGKVLYIDLEKREDSMQERILAYCAAQDIKRTDQLFENIDFVCLGTPEADYFDGSGSTDPLQDWINDNRDAQMIVIDMLAAWKMPEKGQGNSYQLDYQAMKPLRAFALNNGISLLMIHHTNKTGLGMSAISGSNGLAGNADIGLIIKKDYEDGTTGTLQVFGNRIRNSRTLAINWSSEQMRWLILGDNKRIKENEAYKELLNVLDQNKGHFISTTDILSALSDDGENSPDRTTIQRHLNKLVQNGDVEKKMQGNKAFFTLKAK